MVKLNKTITTLKPTPSSPVSNPPLILHSQAPALAKHLGVQAEFLRRVGLWDVISTA